MVVFDLCYFTNFVLPESVHLKQFMAEAPFFCKYRFGHGGFSLSSLMQCKYRSIITIDINYDNRS